MCHSPAPAFCAIFTTVAGIAEIDRVNRLRFEVLQLHGVVVLIAAAGKDHALVRFDPHRLAVLLGNQADDFTIGLVINSFAGVASMTSMLRAFTLS